MASSEVGIASSASPFGCVLRDHNWRDRVKRNSRENCNNGETAFETKIKYLVQDHHLNANISESTPLKNPQNSSELLLNQENNTTREEILQIGRKVREISPCLSDDSSVETKTPGCVSSLVRRWRDFANTKHGLETSNPNSPASFSTPISIPEPNTSLGKSNYFHESVSPVYEETTNDNFGTPCSEKFETPHMTISDDTFLDWDCDRAVPTGPPSAQSRNSEDGGERERVRVADVIRKLKLENETVGNGSEIKLKEHEKTPRIRGRQAFRDLLMQLERDRHMELDRLVERQAVSKFSHRGRIQSMLRLRFLRRDAIVRHHHQQQSKSMGAQQHLHSSPAPAPAPKQSCEESTVIDYPKTSSSGPIRFETQEPDAIVKKQEQSVTNSFKEQNSRCKAAAVDEHLEPQPSELNQMSQGSKVVLLREKFDVLDKTDTATPKAPKRFARSFSLSINSSSTSNQLRDELHQQQEITNTTQASCSFPNSISEETEEISSSTSVPSGEERNFEVDNKFFLESEKKLKEEANYEVHNSSVLKLGKVSTLAKGMEVNNNLQEHDQNNSASLRRQPTYEVDDFYTPSCGRTMTFSNWGEDSKKLEEDHQKNEEVSDHQILENGEEWRNDDAQYWCEWYEEEINNLDWVSDIARPRSDWENLRQERYRDMLDSDDENDEMRKLLERKSVSTFLTSNLRDTMDQLMISRVERVPQSMEDQDEHKVQKFVISSIQTQPDIIKEEEGIEGQESNFSDQVIYSSLEQPKSSQSSCPDTQPFSALTNRSLMDPDYTYDLRAYMEQLHQEISELRKTVNRCMDMQEKMQNSIKQEVSVAVDLSVGKAMKGSANNTTRARSCCLCNEMQVDSLLYRCGHMCACFKCARKLQCSTGKCPICQAPILDVVRAYPDANFNEQR